MAENIVSLQLAGAVEVLNPTPSDPRKRVQNLTEIENSPVYFIGFDNIYSIDDNKHFNVSGGDSSTGWLFVESNSGGGSSDTIYNSDGTLDGDRTITTNGNKFEINTGREFVVGYGNVLSSETSQNQVVFGQQNEVVSGNQVFVVGWENKIFSASQLSSVFGQYNEIIAGTRHVVFGNGAVFGGKQNFGHIANQGGTGAGQSVESEYSHIFTRGTTAGKHPTAFMGIESGANFSAILGGTDNGVQSGHAYSVILGGEGIITDEANTTYVDKLAIDGDYARFRNTPTTDWGTDGNHLVTVDMVKENALPMSESFRGMVSTGNQTLTVFDNNTPYAFFQQTTPFGDDVNAKKSFMVLDSQNAFSLVHESYDGSGSLEGAGSIVMSEGHYRLTNTSNNKGWRYQDTSDYSAIDWSTDDDHITGIGQIKANTLETSSDYAKVVNYNGLPKFHKGNGDFYIMQTNGTNGSTTDWTKLNQLNVNVNGFNMSSYSGDGTGNTVNKTSIVLNPTTISLFNNSSKGAKYQSSSDYSAIDWNTDDNHLAPIGLIKENLDGLGSGAAFKQEFESEITPPPSGKRFRFNNADPLLATKAYFDYTNSDNGDMANILKEYFDSHESIYIQETKNSDVFYEFTIGTTTEQSTYLEVDITLERNGSTPIGDRDKCSILMKGIIKESDKTVDEFEEHFSAFTVSSNSNKKMFSVSSVSPVDATIDNSALEVGEIMYFRQTDTGGIQLTEGVDCTIALNAAGGLGTTLLNDVAAVLKIADQQFITI